LSAPSLWLFRRVEPYFGCHTIAQQKGVFSKLVKNKGATAAEMVEACTFLLTLFVCMEKIFEVRERVLACLDAVCVRPGMPNHRNVSFN
jgi:hypothetical protein